MTRGKQMSSARARKWIWGTTGQSASLCPRERAANSGNHFQSHKGQEGDQE